MLHAHSQDLKEVGFSADFICPICRRAFSADVVNRDLSLAHVWPEALREATPELSKFVVLMCKYCNNTAGSKGDAQMQLALLHDKEEKAGKLLGERKVRLTDDSGLSVILNAEISMHQSEGNLQGSITFSEKRNNPINIEAFRRFAADQVVLSLIVPPHPHLKQGLITAGWITSAYLAAFYTFGYRYIASRYLDPVREYIYKSFSQNDLDLPEGVSVQKFKSNIVDQPRVEIDIPLQPQDNITLKVRYLDVVVTLPFHFDPSAISAFLQIYAPGIYDEQSRIRTDFQEGTFLGIVVRCTKTQVHRCVWDYVLGFGRANLQENKRKMENPCF